MKKLFFSFMMCFMAVSMSAQYVDLGLPSGTKWKTTNEPGFYTYAQAKANFGDNIPSKKQWEEIMDYCEWTWTGRGYKLIGPNGRSIFLPADGMSYFQKHEEKGFGEWGTYYTSTQAEGQYVWAMYFTSSKLPIIDTTDDIYNKKAFSTRLVQ